MAIENYNTEDLDTFRKVQSLAYEAAEYTTSQLKVGMTEKRAAQILEDYLLDRGVTHFFHHSFVWFGNRTRFKDFVTNDGIIDPLEILTAIVQRKAPHFGKQFQPSDLQLEQDMPVILDVAPIIDGCSADIGYATWFGENKIAEKANKDLEAFRPLILEGVLKEKTMAAIYNEVDKLLADLDYESAHAIYPSAVLAHKVGKIPLTFLPAVNVLGFDLQALVYLLGYHNLPFIRTEQPLWNGNSHTRAEAGLWAVEPHIGVGEVGAKWEEILVVTDNNAYWLDDDLPHVRRWQKSEKVHA